ncbi:hypothetical protein HPG69_010819 [Diceros bicornis minor]|uniref:Homeobox domain-containing protein n=1 Tax=Diceros bicornis minor TaxID=77932 RepID=A0A7J7FIR1_DICBM|nr:hypothetical protein HPG69_010819 [Diceros bicornis minor]
MDRRAESAEAHSLFGSLFDSTRDLEPPQQCSDDVTGILSVGVDEDLEEVHEAKPVEISLIGEGGEEGKGIQAEPEQGAAAAEGKEAGDEGEGEEKEDGDVGARAPSPMEVENCEAAGDSGREPGEQGQDEQPSQAAVECLLPALGDRQQPGRRAMFTPVQLWELEGIFRRTPYPDLSMRQELARRMDVPESRVKVSKSEKGNLAGQPF